MSRCVGCNRILTDMEVLGVKPDGSSEDMCYRCLCVVHGENTYVFDKTYVLEHQQEGLTLPKTTLA